MRRLVHGSEDSTDLDVLYIFDEKPSFRECQRFCADKTENRNIIVVRDGVVVECFKGLPDEVNNALLRTYREHAQDEPNPITRAVQRVVPLKVARGIRVILTRLTRTSFRAEVKAALRSHDFDQTRKALRYVDFRNAEIGADALKSVAFQFGQVMALISGQELYTKQEITGVFPDLEPFIYRDPRPHPHLGRLNRCRDQLLAMCDSIRIERQGTLCRFFVDPGATAPPVLNALQAQSRGTVCDLKAERVVVFAPTERLGPLACLVRRPSGLDFMGTDGFESDTVMRARRLAQNENFADLDLERHQHFFSVWNDAGQDSEDTLALVAIRERHTGDMVRTVKPTVPW